MSINAEIPAGPGLVLTKSCTDVPGGTPQAVNGGVYLAGTDVDVPGLPDIQTGGGGTKTATQWKVDFGTAASPRDVTLWVLCASGTGG